jgi:hypothetical protein
LIEFSDGAVLLYLCFTHLNACLIKWVLISVPLIQLYFDRVFFLLFILLISHPNATLVIGVLPSHMFCFFLIVFHLLMTLCGWKCLLLCHDATRNLLLCIYPAVYVPGTCFCYVSYLDASGMINGIFCAGVHVDLSIESDAFVHAGEVSIPSFSPVTGSGDRRGSECS